MIEQFGQNQSSTIQQPLSPQQIKLKLVQSFKILSKKSPTSLQLQKCHEAISQMMKDQLFFDISISLIRQFQHSTQYANIPKLIITTLSTFLKHQQSTSRLVKKIDRYTLNRKLIDTFIDVTIEEEFRVLLIKSYTQYIYAPHMETIRSQTVDLLCNTFGLISIHLKNELSTNSSITQQQTNTLMSYILVARAITKGPIELIYLKSIVITYLPSIEILAIHFLQSLKNSIAQQNQGLFMLRSGICCKLLQFLKQLVIGASKQHSYVIKQSIMMDKNIQQIIYCSLSLSILAEQNNTNTIRQLVIESNGNKYIERINQIKSYCISIVNYFAKLCIQAQSNFKQLQKDQYKMPLQICKYFIGTIPPILIGQFESLNYPSRDLPHSATYKVILNALANIVRINRFFDDSYQIRNRLFFSLCLPLLIRKDEKYVNGQEFKGKRQDILNTHSLDIPENAACKLIESYIDRIDGSIMVFSSALVNTIQFHLSANPKYFNQLPMELINSYFFKDIDYLIQIQCCLSVFALFSYMTIGRQDLVTILQKLLVQRQSFFFNLNSNGMLKASVLLTYAYYVDNFYGNLVANKSDNKLFHIEVLQYCCNNIELFTTTKIQERSKEFLQLQIAALQSLDCITNSITQKLFLQALFWNEVTIQQKANNQYFYALFHFLLKQLYSRVNIGIMDTLLQFFLQAIKNQCKFGHAIKRFHYQYKQVPTAIRIDICNMICQQIYNVFNTSSIPNDELMKSKIFNLLRLVLTCSQFPEQYMNHQFFALQSLLKDIWDVAQPIDIFLRRMILMQEEGRTINRQILFNILKTVVRLLQASLQDNDMHSLFGIIVNLMVIDNELVDQLAVYLSATLIKLLKLQDESNNYDQNLESLIQKVAYLNLIAIYKSFTPNTQHIWCTLTQSIQSFLQARSTKGIIATKSIPYVGKLLTLSLVCLYNMRKIQNIQTQKSIHLWNNVLRSADVYATVTERQIVSSVLVSLLDSQPKIQQNNEQCKKCFTMASHLLYKAYSKAIPTIKQDYDNNQDDSSSGCDDSDYEDHEQGLNYQEYKISNNQYTKKEGKQKYILQFKNICHKLKHQSAQFLLSVVEALPLPIRNFVKTQVFYYESIGVSQAHKIRKVIKVKKVIPE